MSPDRLADRFPIASAAVPLSDTLALLIEIPFRSKEVKWYNCVGRLCW